jgi:predicted murein hydrolase (TIGR00659 family)
MLPFDGAPLARTLGWCAATIVVYVGARALHVRSKNHPLLSSTVLTAVVLFGVTRLAGVSWERYREATRPLQLLLGPATVAFAAPVYRRLADLKKALVPALVAIAGGSLAAALSAMAIARALGASTLTIRSLAPKSVTTPIAMAVSAAVGGSPEITAGFVIFTGMIGGLAVPGIFVLLRVGDRRARGLATGIAAHGFGTARALTLGEVEGAFAILGLGLSGLFVPVVVPWIVRALF